MKCKMNDTYNTLTYTSKIKVTIIINIERNPCQPVFHEFDEPIVIFRKSDEDFVKTVV